MNRRWIFPAVVVAFIGIFTALAVFGPDRGPWNDTDTVRVVQENPDGTTTDTGQTFVIERDRDGFPFPFPILFPFGFLLVLFLIFRFAWGGPRPGGPGCGRQNEDWLNDWHKRQHQESPADPATPASA